MLQQVDFPTKCHIINNLGVPMGYGLLSLNFHIKTYIHISSSTSIPKIVVMYVKW